MCPQWQLSLKSCVSWLGNTAYINGKAVGRIAKNDRGEVCFISPRNRALHFFRLFNGWGMSEDLYVELTQKKVEYAYILVDGMELLEVSLAVWGRGERHKNESPPYEEQLILAEAAFTRLEV